MWNIVTDDYIDVENNGNLFPNKQGNNRPIDGFVFPDAVLPSSSGLRISEQSMNIAAMQYIYY